VFFLNKNLKKEIIKMANKKESNKESFKEKVGSGISNFFTIIGGLFVCLIIGALAITIPFISLLIIFTVFFVFVIREVIKEKNDKK
jgi:uncharacterized membrane protein